MKPNLAIRTVLALGLLAGCASQQGDEFDVAVVGLGAQFQALRRLENEMSRTPGADQREDLRKRSRARAPWRATTRNPSASGNSPRWPTRPTRA